MADDLLLGPPPPALEQLIGEGVEFTPAERALRGLDASLATQRPGGSPYSIAELLAHMRFWQARVLEHARGQTPAPVEHAAEGWRAVTAGEWDELVEEYLRGLGALKNIARDARALERPIGRDQRRSVGYLIASNSGHDAHHLGQIILLRRMLGAWPPEGGGDTW